MQLAEAKVAWTTLRLGRNGNLLYMGPLLKGLARSCKSFCAFTVEFGGDSANAGFDITQAGSIRIVGRRTTRDGIPLGIPLVTPTIMREVFRFKPDLLILNEFGLLTVYGMLLSLILRHARILLIVENRPVDVGSSLSKAMRRFYRRMIARRAAAILTNNITGKSYLTQELGVDARKITCRPYLVSDMSHNEGLLKQTDASNQTRNESMPIRFLYVGRLIQSKGLQHALASLGILKRTHPGKFMLDIVGDGPFRSALEIQYKELGLEEYVHFHGQQPYDSLARLYSEADVFLFPTLMDYRSLVCFEAMSIGLPILASIHDGGSIETVKECENGFTFDPEDHPRLAELMSRFIDQPALLNQFSERSRVMSKPYTLTRAVESVVIAGNLALGTHKG